MKKLLEWILILRSLSCDRIRVHQNFMFSLVLLYVTTIGMVSSPLNNILHLKQKFDPETIVFFKCIKRWQIRFSVYFAPYINQQAAGHTVWYKSQPWICQTMKASLMFCFQSPIFWVIPSCEFQQFECFFSDVCGGNLPSFQSL